MTTTHQPWIPGVKEPAPVPLLPQDPPRIADFWLDARLYANEAGVCYLGHAEDNPEVMICMLNSGAANDYAAKDRLAGEVNKLHAETVIARGGDGQDGGRLAGKFVSEDDDPVSPDAPPLAGWVALAYDASPAALGEAKRLLNAVQLSSTPPLGPPRGPDYGLGWTRDQRPGMWRLWPTSWPGRHDRAGWVPLAVSWLLTIFIAGLILLIAVLLFQNQPPETPPPPVPTNQSGGQSDQSNSASPSDGSPSDGSPSDQSASPGEGSPSESSSDSSPTKEPSMGSSGSGEATDTQPPENTKL